MLELEGSVSHELCGFWEIIDFSVPWFQPQKWGNNGASFSMECICRKLQQRACVTEALLVQVILAKCFL